ncbi:hypothetical protein [Chitinophaga sp. LS1]|uniref:hypothetical protein n=1 Tax=Chitinophaga sp. LS1 TaxID=3051176 RepID=UPI002AAC06CD|nr:hypothetical protein [Chitinophaga sp. LS1]WPV65687.1 hypothetical protein QQL36_28185 [Chitinophaga sp. LS1]
MRKNLSFIISFFVVLLIVVFNIKYDHIKLDTDSNRTSFHYYLTREKYSPEFYVALLSLYPLLILTIIMLFGKSHRLVFLFLGIFGIFSIISLWLLMHLHFDAIIISYKESYYSTLIMGILSVAGCAVVLFIKRKQ